MEQETIKSLYEQSVYERLQRDRNNLDKLFCKVAEIYGNKSDELALFLAAVNPLYCHLSDELRKFETA